MTSNVYTPGTPYSATSKTFASQLDANAACQAAATTAGYGGNWAAVLGDKNKSTYDYLTQANGNTPLDSTRSVVTAAGLTVSGPVYNEANSQPGDFSNIQAWTNMPTTLFWVAPGNQKVFYGLATSHTCVNWTSDSVANHGNLAQATLASGSWHQSGPTCNTAAALLCIELDG